jgi:hypothetical protein
MTTERDKRPPEERASGGTTQVGPALGDVERLTRRLPASRGRRPRPYRNARSGPPREQIVNLVAALGDTTHPLHATAVDELVEIGAPTVHLLCEQIGPQRPWLAAYRAAEAAGRIGDGRASGPLISALNHPNSNVRWSAVRALTTVGDVRAIFELRRIAQSDQGRTSWGEPVAGAAQSALDQLSQRSVWGQSIELIKTAVTSVLMILALTLGFSVVSTVRSELDRFGLYIPGQTQLPQLVLPTVAPTATHPAQPTVMGLASPVPTGTPGVGAVNTGTMLQDANVRPQPNTNNQPIGQINQGDEVIFLARTPGGQWYLVRLGSHFDPASSIANSDGSGTGWINSALVTQPVGDLPVRQPATVEPTLAPALTPTAGL